MIKKRQENLRDEDKLRELNKSIIDEHGNDSLFKEFYQKSFLPKASKITKEIHREPLPRVRKLCSEKLKEMNSYSRKGKLDRYDSDTIQTRSRLVQSIVDSQTKLDEKDDF